MPLATARSSGADAARTERTGGSPDGLRGRQGVAARLGARWGLRRSVRFRTPSLRAEVARDHPALLSYRLDASHAGLGKQVETSPSQQLRPTIRRVRRDSGRLIITDRVCKKHPLHRQPLPTNRQKYPGQLLQIDEAGGDAKDHETPSNVRREFGGIRIEHHRYYRQGRAVIVHRRGVLDELEVRGTWFVTSRQHI